MSRPPKEKALIADLPVGVSAKRWLKGNAEYIRVRLGKRFTGGKVQVTYHRSIGEARDHIFGDAKKEKKTRSGVIDLKQRAGASAFEMSAAEIHEAQASFKKCREKGLSLSTVVDFGIRHISPPGGRKTFSDVSEALLALKTRQGRSDSHIANMRSIFDRFAEDYGKTSISLITRAMIEEWQGEQDDTDKHARSVGYARLVAYARNLHIAFQYAVDQEWCDRNPCRTLDRSVPSSGDVEFLRVKALASLFQTAMAEQPNIVAGLAIKAFAGVRTGELVKLTWAEVGSAQIHITGKKSKSRTSRPIAIPENLKGWLAEYRKKEGLVSDSDSAFTWCSRMSRLSESTAIELPYNCLRHGFGTFHYHRFKNENLTASEMGNSPAVVRAYYVAPNVEPDELELYWGLQPSTLKRTLQMAS